MTLSTDEFVDPKGIKYSTAGPQERYKYFLDLSKMSETQQTIANQKEKGDIQNLELEELQELLEVNPAKWIGISLFIAGFLVITPLLNAVPEFFS